jgi:hypothetical protein
MARLIRLVLALYPRSVRARYGDEITDLLTRSATPRRDLADVARCALLDRVAALRVPPGLRLGLVRSTGLLATPVVFGIALLAMASVTVAGLGLLEGLGLRVGDRPGRIGIAASAVPVVAGAVWLARRAGRGGSVPAPVFVVPTASALGTVALASLPYVGEALGETRSAILLTSLCWYVAMMALATGGAALVRRSGRAVARAVTALGGLAVLHLCCAVYVLLVHRAYGLPPSSALSAYPAVVAGLDGGLAGDPAGQVAEALKGLPALLTVCTAFTLTLVVTRAGRLSGTRSR